MTEAMPHLSEHAFDRQSEIQCGNADRIKTPAFGGRSFA
jgi:hypothetical protein